MAKPGQERGLQHFVDDAHNLEPGEFIARHGVAFLVRSTVDGPLQPPDKLSGDDWFRPNPHATMAVPTRASMENRAPGERFFVHCIPSRGTGDEDEFPPVTIGRAPASDVWINDKSVSKLHAQLHQKADGSFEISDRGSRNGTKIGGDPVEVGQAAPVAFGKTLQFGRVRLTLMPAKQFIDFVRALG